MIVRRLIPWRSPWRTVQAPVFGRTRFPYRRLHGVPTLSSGLTYQDQGVPDLIGPEGYDLAWNQYQGLMIDKLNEMTQGTPDEQVKIKDLIVAYARQADRAALFNHASMAYNNHFFFHGLSPRSTIIPKWLEEDLLMNFSSLQVLRDEMIVTADSMFGPGFVWLVRHTDQRQRYGIVTTYLAGSPFPGAHHRMQPVNMANQNVVYTGPHSAADISRQTTIQNRSPGHSSQRTTTAPGGLAVIPLLCVNVWPYVWLIDYGVAGKRDFLERWWDRIDWGIVANHAEVGRIIRTRP